MPLKLALGRLLVIDLHVLHCVVRQVLQHHLVLALEEVGTVQRQVLYLLAIDEYLAVVLQFHTWQLLDESVEHRALRNVEGIGIIDNGIALIYHLHLRGLHHHLQQ